eukprot:g1183.t1
MSDTHLSLGHVSNDGSTMTTSATPTEFSIDSEWERMKIPPMWRISTINKNYEFCSSYPKSFIVPKKITDESLKKVGKWRSKHRIPVATWIDPQTNAAICRCAQPNAGVTGESEADKNHFLEIMNAQTKVNALTSQVKTKPKLLLLDARPKIAAVGNMLKGKGFEGRSYASIAEMEFCGIGNIHAVRYSYNAFSAIASQLMGTSGALSALHGSKWLLLIAQILSASVKAAQAVHIGRSVVVHCSDGWDRTPQLSSLAALMLDGYYRTMAGFLSLVKKFGHKFATRLGMRCEASEESGSQESPIFIQWLDCVYQIQNQFPDQFEFNQKFLEDFADYAASGWFGDFLANDSRQREDLNLEQRSFSLLRHFEKHSKLYLNSNFSPNGSPIFPIANTMVLQVWSYYNRNRIECTKELLLTTFPQRVPSFGSTAALTIFKQSELTDKWAKLVEYRMKAVGNDTVLDEAEFSKIK